MSIAPIITFKAGQCEVDISTKPYKVKPAPKPGYVYLYSEDDDLIHFCWRERGATMEEPDLDLVMVPTDGHFEPYEYKTTDQHTSKTNGRIFVLKFSSSSQRHLFWLQSKPQARNGDASWFSPRDLKIGQIVDTLLQGEEVDVMSEIAQVQDNNQDGDDDETMGDADGPGSDLQRTISGGAGADATGGDVRDEGEEAREGGVDGGRAASSAANDASAIVQNFLNSLKGSQGQGNSDSSDPRIGGQRLYTTLNDLLPPATIIPLVDSADVLQVDNLLSHLPPTLLLLAQESAASIDGTVEPSAAAAAAALEALSLEQKKALLRRVMRSPQFHQSLASLTNALREGGLPSIAGALGIEVPNRGQFGGGDAVEAFVEGVKRAVEEENK